MSIRLVFYGEPISRKAPLVLRSGVAIHKNSEIAKKRELRISAKSQLPIGFKLLDFPIVITELRFVFTPLASLTKKEKEFIAKGYEIPKSTKPDIDNLEKLLYDSLEGVVYVNDSRIYQKSNIGKYYGNKPRIEIEIAY